MNIGEKTLRKGGEMLTNIMLSYISKINEAFLHNGESELKIGLDLTIKPGAANGNFKLQSGIKFITEQIKDTFSDSCDELQGNLFEEKEKTYPCYLRPEGDSVLKKVCMRCHSRIDVIFVSGIELPKVIPYKDEVPTPDPKKGQMLQYSSCPAWADNDYQTWMEVMIFKEAEKKPKEETPKLKKIAGGKR